MPQKKSHLKPADLRGYAKMVTDATLSITELVEEVHHRIVHHPSLPSTPVQHIISAISGFVFKSIKGITRLVGGGIHAGLSKVEHLSDHTTSSIERETAFAIMNGLVGDYLESSENPIAIPMQFRYEGKPILPDADHIRSMYPKLNGKILLMVHGLCMNDLQWEQNEHNHGERLASVLHLTPIYLHYNSGLHISTNGRQLNQLLQDLLEFWPENVESISILAHSMGGLVCRSAIHYGRLENNSWLTYLDKIVFLGTPHHGARLEQAGNYIDHLIEAGHYTKPFAQIGKMRSSGITDLRYGNLVDEDWQGIDRFEKGVDQRQHIPLPAQVDCYALATNKSLAKNTKAEQALGDGLVQLNSALGKHKSPEKSLAFKAANQRIVEGVGHIEMLGNRQVYDQLRNWLTE